MGRMTPHEFLINVVGSTVLNIVPFPTAPIAPSGVLAKDFGYEIRLPKFGETVQDLMKKRGAKIPDLLLVNEKEKLFIIVECKSDFTFEMEERLSRQILFYSSEDFKEIWKEMFPDLDNLEIWVFSSKNFVEKIANFISHQEKDKGLANIVVWGVELRKAREEARIQKFYGTHMDSKLNEQMESDELVCSPPRIDLLVDPTLAYGERVFRIGRRILGFIASSYLSEKDRIVTLQDFRKRHPDAIMTDRELKRCLRYLLKLIPEIGEFNSATGELVLAKKPSLDKVKNKLEKIQEMSEEEIKLDLAKISKKMRVGMAKVPKAKQKTKITEWLPKNAISESSCLPYYDLHVEALLGNSNYLLMLA
ncbi:MAG: hypothetical protein OEY22_02205 [Candidatus Bathyarchaeota archaeon]|nr:hypothetical protein [Candidatus Bathyarchaeota archaeon]MDH5788647.1 hypothetical protein [Candidatus Bathyarchaeota archaeon]